MNVNPYLHQLRATIGWLAAGLLLAAGLNATAPRTLEFFVYAQRPLPALAYPVSQTPLELTQILSHPLSSTGPYAFQGGNRIDFYHPQTHALAAQVQLPEHSAQWLLIFANNPRYPSDPERALRYRIFALDLRPGHYPADSLLFLNLSGHDLNGQVNEAPLQLSMGPSRPIAAPASAELRLWLWLPGHNLQRLPGWIKRCHFSPGQRHLLILFPPVLSGSCDLDVRQLSEPLP